MAIDREQSALGVSLFEHLQHHFGERLHLLNCTKATLVHLSHSLEDLVLREQLPAILFTGFQESSHWREETERYRALATVAQQVCIFAGGQLPPEANEKEIHVTLMGDDPLRQEWFLCILSTKFAVVLCGQDRKVPAKEEATRQFATLWTLDPVVVNDVLDKCEEVVKHYRPDRAAELRQARENYPPLAPDPVLMTDLTWGMIQFEEQMHQSLVRTTEMLEQQLKWQEDMISLLVHDLRAPLQSILMSLQMTMMTGDVSNEQAEMLSIAERSTHAATDLVQMMLDTTKLEYRQFPIQVQPILLSPLLERSAQAISGRIKHQSLQLKQVVAADLPVIWGDVALIERVLINLLTNACKYTPPGGTITIGATLHPGSKRVELYVRDTGRGIPPRDQQRIFERLAQVSDEDRRKGSGLGLYFCRLAVEAHSGSIRVNSQMGMGSTFTVNLPIRPLITIAE
jgi:signal transduction histidine kinase